MTPEQIKREIDRWKDREEALRKKVPTTPEIERAIEICVAERFRLGEELRKALAG